MNPELTSIRQAISGSSPVRDLLARVKSARAGGRGGTAALAGPVATTGVSGSLTACIASAARDEFSSGVIVVAPDDETAEKLRDAGFSTVADIRGATPEALAQVPGVSEKKAQALIACVAGGGE